MDYTVVLPLSEPLNWSITLDPQACSNMYNVVVQFNSNIAVSLMFL